LPPETICSYSFLNEIITGSKKAFTNDQVKYIEVPYYREFTTQRLYDLAYASSKAKQYLPD
jgi:hypothetical protein